MLDEKVYSVHEDCLAFFVQRLESAGFIRQVSMNAGLLEGSWQGPDNELLTIWARAQTSPDDQVAKLIKAPFQFVRVYLHSTLRDRETAVSEKKAANLWNTIDSLVSGFGHAVAETEVLTGWRRYFETPHRFGMPPE